MEIFNSIATVSLYAVLTGVLLTAIFTVTTRSLFHSAIFLAFTLLGVAVIYFFLHAEFLAGIQILLYVGAIMTLIIFAIMLTAKIGDPSVSQSNRQRFPALILLIILASFIVPAMIKTSWKPTSAFQTTTAVQLGKALMGEFVFPFELISLVLLIALVGAIVIARSDQ